MSKPTSPYTIEMQPGKAALWSKRKPLLSKLDIELIERCNNDCIHCCINLPVGDRDAKRREMNTEQVKRILDQAAELGALQVRFTGGEPLLRQDFEELYLYARRLGLKVLIFTNGRLISPELADLLQHVPPLVPMEITIYGMQRQSYEAVSQAPGSFEQFQRGIRLLLERGVSFVVKCALLPPNQEEIEEFEDWARKTVGMREHPSYAIFLDLRGRRDSEEKNQQIRELRFTPEAGLAILKRDPARYRKGMIEFCSKFMGPPGEKLFNCGAGLGGCVDAYGRLQMCMMLRDPETTVDLIHSERPEPLFQALSETFVHYRQMKAIHPEYLRRCARCILKGLCEQCPAKSYAEHGVLDQPVEYLCQVAHAQARDLGLLAEDEFGWQVENPQERIARLAVQV